MKAANGMQFGLTAAPAGTPALPHRLEAESSVMYYLDLVDVAVLCDVATTTDKPAGKIVGRVELGSGRTIASKRAFEALDLIARLDEIRAASR